MFEYNRASIDAASLRKGQCISGDTAWNCFVIEKPDLYNSWLNEYGDEELSKAARLSQVLLQVRNQLMAQRSKLNLPELVMNTVGGSINILTDEEASKYLDAQANQGVRRFGRSYRRLITAVDSTQMNAADRRTHENRINKNAFIQSALSGSQSQLRKLNKAGRPAPNFDNS